MIERAAKAAYEEWSALFLPESARVPWTELNAESRYLWARIAQNSIDAMWKARGR